MAKRSWILILVERPVLWTRISTSVYVTGSLYSFQIRTKIFVFVIWSNYTQNSKLTLVLTLRQKMFPVSSGFPLQDPMANLEFQRFSFNLRLIYIKTLCIWHLKHNLSNALGLHYNFNDGARKKKKHKKKKWGKKVPNYKARPSSRERSQSNISMEYPSQVVVATQLEFSLTFLRSKLHCKMSVTICSGRQYCRNRANLPGARRKA